MLNNILNILNNLNLFNKIIFSLLLANLLIYIIKLIINSNIVHNLISTIKSIFTVIIYYIKHKYISLFFNNKKPN
jgi:hypothetical protein